jgi:cell wall-associated NlpC family hydrolase
MNGSAVVLAATLQMACLDPSAASALPEPVVRAACPPAATAVREALSLLGTPYRRGSTDPRRGLDCSSLVRRVFRPLGLDLPFSAAGQLSVGEQVERESLAPGDLVFFRNTYKRGISHVGIYLGGDRFVHAASRRRGVVVSSLDQPYYRQRFAGARRLLEAAALGLATSLPPL